MIYIKHFVIRSGLNAEWEWWIDQTAQFTGAAHATVYMFAAARFFIDVCSVSERLLTKSVRNLADASRCLSPRLFHVSQE